MTDDAAIAEWAGLPVSLVMGSPSNNKITSAEDLAMAERTAAGSHVRPDIRTGQGIDVHRLVPQRQQVLPGVDPAAEVGLVHAAGNATGRRYPWCW